MSYGFLHANCNINIFYYFQVALVYGQMNEPPGARARVALTGLTVAEYFRDEEGQDVLLFIDNIFRFTQAGSEVSALLGRIPSAVGYQPTLATDLGPSCCQSCKPVWPMLSSHLFTQAPLILDSLFSSHFPSFRAFHYIESSRGKVLGGDFVSDGEGQGQAPTRLPNTAFGHKGFQQRI